MSPIRPSRLVPGDTVALLSPSSGGPAAFPHIFDHGLGVLRCLGPRDPDLPIVANLDFGHTDPQWVLPIGARAELDVDAGRLRLVEPWLS